MVNPSAFIIKDVDSTFLLRIEANIVDNMIINMT